MGSVQSTSVICALKSASLAAFVYGLSMSRSGKLFPFNPVFVVSYVDQYECAATSALTEVASLEKIAYTDDGAATKRTRGYTVAP